MLQNKYLNSYLRIDDALYLIFSYCHACQWRPISSTISSIKWSYLCIDSNILYHGSMKMFYFTYHSHLQNKFIKYKIIWFCVFAHYYHGIKYWNHDFFGVILHVSTVIWIIEHVIIIFQTTYTIESRVIINSCLKLK